MFRIPRAVLSAPLALALFAAPGAHAQSIARATQAIAAPPVLAQASGTKFATVTAKNCVVYEAPNEDAKIKARAKRGEFLEVGGIKGNWIKVRTKSGQVGYVVKTDVVPGKKNLATGETVSGGGGSKSGGGTKRPPPGRGNSGIGSGVTVEGRTGLLAKAGLGFAANAYGFQAAQGFKRDIGMKTAYAGINTDVDYWFIPLAGAHGRFSSTFGSMTAVLKEPINKRVDRIPTNINRIEIDGQGRWFFGEGASSPSVLGRLGYHIHEMRIDPVIDGTEQPLFLVSQSYQGLVVGLGGDMPLGGPQMGLRAQLDYWIAPSLKEGSTGAASQPSGKPAGATGLGFSAGGYYNLNDQAGLDVGIEYASFTGTFSGEGRRFNQGIRDAKTTDTYLMFVVNGTYRY